MSEVCKGQELEFSALGDFGGHPFSGSVLVSRVVLCVIVCTESSSIHSHSGCEHKWSVSSYTITAAVNKLPVMCLDKLSLEKSLYAFMCKNKGINSLLNFTVLCEGTCKWHPCRKCVQRGSGKNLLLLFQGFFKMLLGIKESWKKFHWPMLCHRDWNGKCVLDRKLSGRGAEVIFHLHKISACMVFNSYTTWF